LQIFFRFILLARISQAAIAEKNHAQKNNLSKDLCFELTEKFALRRKQNPHTIQGAE
jgi:hypothetical protein